jgi:membrane-bound ClpP family serine protease
MNDKKASILNLEGIAWGAVFVWWGITELVPSLPHGLGAAVIGLILIGLNLARVKTGVPTSAFTTVVGIVALVWGGWELASPVLNLSFEIPVFAVLLIVFGVFVMGNSVTRRSAAQ